MENPEHRLDGTPLSEPTYFILLSLLPGPGHGYAIMKDVHRLSGERVTLSTGTLYGALKRLLEQGWIMRIEESSAPVDGRDRKAYRLTNTGRAALQSEVERLRLLVSAARSAESGSGRSLERLE